MDTYITNILLLTSYPLLLSINAFSYMIKPKDELGMDIEIIPDYSMRHFKKIIISTILLSLINYVFIDTGLENRLLISLLYLVSIYDIRFKLVPDRYMIIILTLVLADLLFNLDKHSFIESILTCVVVFVIFYLVALITNGGIGGADIKLFSILGLMFPYQEMILIVFLTYLLGIVFVMISYMITKNKQVALIPYISLATGITIMYGYEILNWYNYGGFNEFITTITGGL